MRHSLNESLKKLQNTFIALKYSRPLINLSSKQKKGEKGHKSLQLGKEFFRPFLQK
jgi:hypothetical protein